MQERFLNDEVIQESRSSDTCAYYHSPVGVLKITGNDSAIISIEFLNESVQETNSPEGAVKECIRQLEEYFSGKRKSFELKFDLRGTEFQKKVWNELINIPFGKTISYLELARSLGDEKVIRAAGSANGKNPVAIVIPCHRVIGSNGDLVGYGGGMHRKKWLLEFESGTRQVSLF